MAHAQKPHFVFRRNGRVHLNRWGASVQSTTGSRGVRISGSNAGYSMFRGSVKSTGYPLHSPVSPSLPLPCVTVCHHSSAGVYQASCATTIEPTAENLRMSAMSLFDFLPFDSPNKSFTLAQCLSFQDHYVNGASVVTALQVRASAMLL